MTWKLFNTWKLKVIINTCMQINFYILRNLNLEIFLHVPSPIVLIGWWSAAAPSPLLAAICLVDGLNLASFWDNLFQYGKGQLLAIEIIDRLLVCSSSWQLSTL